jgi:hypothetical protein
MKVITVTCLVKVITYLMKVITVTTDYKNSQ